MSFPFTIVILWLHVLGAVVWIGGLIFQLLVVAPVLKRGPLTLERLRYSVSLDVRFRYVMWPAVGLVLLTGLYNFINVLYATSLAGGTIPPAFVSILSIKLLLVVLMIVLQAIQRFVVHPRTIALLTRLSSETIDPSIDLPKSLRVSYGLHAFTVGVAVVVILLGLRL